MSGRIPVLYLAPWITFGGSDKNTIDWFRWIDRERFAPYLITTQPSENQLLSEVVDHAEEVWDLADLMPAERMPEFILDFVVSRGIRVVHVMNSRLGFDLLPDLTSLPVPPKVVVQLHVEEVDRSGYVRYVSSRYGNLVDRFSISNQTVAEAVRGYGVPDEAIEVIYTGVDTEEEFAPGGREPAAGVDPERLQVLWAGRLVEQKDPLLMVEVAAALHQRGVEFQLQVVGAGELEGRVRQRVSELGLADQVVLNPPTPGLQAWYEATDALLMTSTFEGVPVVVFEAMSMGLPIVAPALPGIRELLDAEGDLLVVERDRVEAYAEPLARLAADREAREAIGADLRQRAQSRFSVQEMAQAHERIYTELDQRLPPAPEEAPVEPLPAPLRFLDRAVRDQPPLVSIVIPHFNQTRFLDECLDSIAAQTHPAVETIVVDDGSTERGVEKVLAELERRGDVTVLRLQRNGGPSRARNHGIAACGGRYVLPVDSDNVLLPDAVERLVEQLSEAGEEVGFVYPNLQYFGNRSDYHEAPEYNLNTLLYGNFCDTCSLIDREVFAAGLLYSEDIHLGHEDWEFALQLAAHGVRGEPAHGPTVRYRKWGFNRSDLVDHGSEDFRDDFLAEVSPFRGRELEVKREEAPALSIVALEPVDVGGEEGAEAARLLAAQLGADVELVARFEGEWPALPGSPPVRRLHPALAETPGDGARQGIEAARGAYVAVSEAPLTRLLADPALLGKILNRFQIAGDDLSAIALVDAGDERLYPFRTLRDDEGRRLAPHTVIWRRNVELTLPQGLQIGLEQPAGFLAALLGGLPIEWRHLAAGADTRGPSALDGDRTSVDPNPANVEDPFDLRPNAQALLPGAGTYKPPPRWQLTPSWAPPLSTLAVRYRERFSELRMVTNGTAPAGYEGEFHLGALRSTGFPGTKRLVAVAGTYRTVEADEEVPGAREIGYLETARLPEMDVLALAVVRSTGQHVLVSLADDPLLAQADVIEELGCLDGFPLFPRESPAAAGTLGLLGLVKAADAEARRFRYSIGSPPASGELVQELGALAVSELQATTPAWIVDGYLATSAYTPPAFRPGPLSSLRWSAEPLAWRGTAPASTQAKAIARRAVDSARRRGAKPEPMPLPAEPPHGYLFADYQPGRVPLYSGHHPVTGDQCLVRALDDLAQLGYVGPQLLGYLRLTAPLTGSTDYLHPPIPWARRFGAVPQRG